MYSVAADTHYSLAMPCEIKRSGQERCLEIKFEWRYWVLCNEYRNMLSRYERRQLKPARINLQGRKKYY